MVVTSAVIHMPTFQQAIVLTGFNALSHVVDKNRHIICDKELQRSFFRLFRGTIDGLSNNCAIRMLRQATLRNICNIKMCALNYKLKDERRFIDNLNQDNRA